MTIKLTFIKIILVFILIFQIFSCSNSNVKLKELELKERELNLKEREIETQRKSSYDIQNNISTAKGNTSTIKKSDLIYTWLPTHAPAFSITFNADNTFSIEEDGIDEKVHGSYSFESDVIKMNFPSGESKTCSVVTNPKWGICINFNDLKLRRE